MPIKHGSLGFVAFMALISVGLAGCDSEPRPTVSAPVVIDSATAAVVNGEAIYIRDVELEAVRE